MIYLITHGDKKPGNDPGLTLEGIAQTLELKNYLPPKSRVICGTGARHIETAQILGLTPERYTCIVGTGDSSENGVVVLSCGATIASLKYTSTEDMGTALAVLIRALSSDEDYVIIAGRPAGTMLGKRDTKAASVYKIQIEIGFIVLEELISLGNTG